VASLRHEIRIAAAPDEVGPSSHDGVDSRWFRYRLVHVEGNVRVIKTPSSGDARGNTYKIRSFDASLSYYVTVYRFHLGVIDVIEIGPTIRSALFTTGERSRRAHHAGATMGWPDKALGGRP